MKLKLIAVLVLSISLAFLLGVKLSGDRQPVIASSAIDSVSKDSTHWIEAITSFLNAKELSDTTVDYRDQLKGVFHIEGSNIAGFDFFSRDTISWTDELNFNSSDTLAIKWLSPSIFTVRSIQRSNKVCPPSVWAYQVLKYDGKRLLLKDFWLGWNDQEDEVLLFNKVSE